MFQIAEDTEEIQKDLLDDLGIDHNYSSSSLQALVDGGSLYVEYLRVNLKNTLKSEYLSEQ